MWTLEQKIKTKIFAKGISIDQSVFNIVKTPLTLDSYGTNSGVILKFPSGIYVNAPFSKYNYNFVKNSLIRLVYSKSKFYLHYRKVRLEVEVIPIPSFYNKMNSQGILYSELAVTHTDRVCVAPITGCNNHCKFCTLSKNYQYRKDKIEESIEATKVALVDPVLPGRHILISGGTPRPADYEYMKNFYRSFAKEFKGIPIDIMMIPNENILDLEELKKIGIDSLCINLELYNEKLLKIYAPEKALIGREKYLKFIEKAVKIFGQGKVRSLLVIGLEPIEEILKAVEALACIGCDPVLSPFRPAPGTPLEKLPSLSYELMAKAYRRAEKIVAKYPGVVLGPRCKACGHNTLSF
ncbi:MAG: Radical SAM domain protein [Parcubacteria group bacterium GW2011_GWC2_39_14]|nr:MAG: Radical SAM domain protein [Parcubacteria group bacterium GW2011_GWC2_39_14]KKR54343.1 MAG: Radical SAM domain protein [Parcubacteria group bacterium GW2011_GWA2_40_23]